LKFWEPDAPAIDERLRSLQYAFENGYRTSISCEPSLDNKVPALVEKLAPYVNDYIWIGKANEFERRLMLNGTNDNNHIMAAHELVQLQSPAYIEALYEDLKEHPKIKWKDSIKETLGIPTNPEPGMDI
jgi:DNA repair photolyase